MLQRGDVLLGIVDAGCSACVGSFRVTLRSIAAEWVGSVDVEGAAMLLTEGSYLRFLQ